MGYPPVVVVDSGGVPRTQVAEGGSAPAYTVVESGARPITLTTNAPPIALFNEDGSHYIAGPPAILGSSLIAWWTADRADLITLNGSAVTSWRDVVAGYDAVQVVGAARPVYSATDFNSAPSLTFDGVDDELSLIPAPAAWPIGSATPFEMWGVVQQDAPGADVATRYAASLGSGTTGTRRGFGRVSGGTTNRARALSGTGAADVTRGGTIVDLSSRHVLRTEIRTDSVVLAVDGIAEGSTAVALASNSLARFRIGSLPNTTASSFWQGKVRDILITLPLTTEQSARLDAWALPRRML